ncbi:MAG: DNA gyrase/topoisomerase IV subunit A, partial [Muribaculaceae bacterium]|nr:DNA gyrase/topoisomerase IV subunit A [Muribaculaceae bacterium]
IALSDHDAPMFELQFSDDGRVPALIDAEDFIGVKSFKARGKRLTTYGLASVTELEPKRPDADSVQPEEAAEDTAGENDAAASDAPVVAPVAAGDDAAPVQQTLFEDESDS